MNLGLPQKCVLNTPVTCLTFEEQVMLMLRWAKTRESRSVCLANVHMLMEAHWNHQFAQILEKADMVTPDGMPLVWMLNKLGINNQNRVAGLDVFINLCELAQQSQIGIYFVGSEHSILTKMKRRLETEYPILHIAGMDDLPNITIEDVVEHLDITLIERINQSGAGIVFVCLGCPKQEIWMNQYRGKIQAVMIGVGAVFSMYAGVNPRAPHWLQKIGLEWLYRLSQEPQRLWLRYGQTIPSFLYLASRQLMIPRKEKLEQARQSLSEGNVILDIDNLDASPSKIGEILVRQGLLTQLSLEKALLEQTEFPNLKLGEILAKNNLISLPQLRYYLKNQRITLGEILLDHKLIKSTKIDRILALQENRTQRLGEILVELNLLSDKQIKMALLEQYWRRKGWWLN